MHTLLESSFKDIDLHAFIGQVVEGLNDDEEVKKLCYLMLVKLAAVAPTATAQSASFFAGAIEQECLGLMMSRTRRRRNRAVAGHAEHDAQGQRGQARDGTPGRAAKIVPALHLGPRQDQLGRVDAKVRGIRPVDQDWQVVERVRGRERVDVAPDDAGRRDGYRLEASEREEHFCKRHEFFQCNSTERHGAVYELKASWMLTRAARVPSSLAHCLCASA